MLFAASAAQAFNAPAHRVVGYVAADNVCTATAAAIAEVDPDRSLAEAGTWADEIRSNDHWDALKPWHYMNVPDGIPLDEAKRSRRGDVLQGIEKFAAELADPETESLDRQIAYRLLVHRFRLAWLSERAADAGLEGALVERRAEGGASA